MTPPVLVTVAGLNRGRLRSRNEDSLLVGDQVLASDDRGAFLTRPGGLPVILAVADGMGGHPCGDLASDMACRLLAEPPVPQTAAELIDRLIGIDRTLKDMGQARPECRGMGTTIAGVMISQDAVLAFNVGDSVVFRIEESLLRRVSVIDALTDEPGRSGALLQCLGGWTDRPPPEPHVIAVPMDPACPFLLCTDGLTHHLSVWDIEGILSRWADDPVRAVDSLIDAACAAGGHDNMAVILCQWQKQGVPEDV